MKKITIISLLTVLTVCFSIETFAQKSDFNGKWKLDYGKSILPEYTPVLTRINITINGDSLLTERFYDTGDGQIYPFTENLTLDNKEFRITIYDMPRKSKANWSAEDNAVMVESATTVGGYSGSQDFISKETWKVDSKNKTLTISFKNSIEGNEVNGMFLFTMAE